MIGLHRGAVVVDVGANVGDFSECVLAFQPWARLYLVEPLEETHPELRRKFGEYAGVMLDSFALGSEEGEREFFVSRYDQASSFLEIGTALETGAYGLDFTRKEVRRVRIRRLEDYLRERSLERVDLLKLDVQGFELEVLRGAGDALSRTDWIYADAQFQERHKMALLERSSTPEDVAATVRFALDNRSITGTTLLVDGGQHLMRFERDFSLM